MKGHANEVIEERKMSAITKESAKTALQKGKQNSEHVQKREIAT